MLKQPVLIIRCSLKNSCLQAALAFSLGIYPLVATNPDIPLPHAEG